MLFRSETACKAVERDISAILKMMKDQVEFLIQFKDVERSWGYHGDLEHLRAKMRESLETLILTNSNNSEFGQIISEQCLKTMIDNHLAASRASAK